MTLHGTSRFFAILVTVACALATATPGVLAEEARIVVLGPQTTRSHQNFVEGFKHYLGEQDKSLEFFDVELDDAQRTANSVSDIVEHNNSPMIVTLGPTALHSSVQAPLDCPVIASLTVDQSELDRYPNVTGVILDHAIETQLLWIKRIIPTAKTVGVLYNPDQSGAQIAVAQEAARKIGLKLIAQKVNSPQELPIAMESLFRHVDVLWGIADPVVLSRRTAKAVLLTSFRNKVPFVAPSPAWVKAGALYALEYDYRDMGVQSGEMALHVLKGKPISAIPPQAPRAVHYTLNLRTAEHMRLDLSHSIVDGAAQVFR